MSREFEVYIFTVHKLVPFHDLLALLFYFQLFSRYILMFAWNGTVCLCARERVSVCACVNENLNRAYLMMGFSLNI